MGGSCATGHCEPCQAGNRAALSSCFRAPQQIGSFVRFSTQVFFKRGDTTAYRALYRKYRPSAFSQVVGQEHITETLKGELAAGKTVHAYLFTGTRGTGKTSCAKILAKAVNCLNPQNGDPCGECEMCRAISAGEITDIVEIDAASNNGVDDIRELREQVNFAPAAAKYRVYIIDEVHMLTVPAFNALLKTLEEPPAHVIFILATTEVYKLPATILSRCQRFDFRRIDPQKICERIRFIAMHENLSVTDDAAMLIASAADGGMRDALSILDLCASHSREITEDTVAECCAMAGNDYLLKLADFIHDRNTEGALLLIDELHNSSVDMLRLLSELTRHYRDLMIVKTVKSDQKPIVCSVARMKKLREQAEKYDIKEILSILEYLQSAAAGMQSGDRRCEMEMTVIKLCRPEVVSDLTQLEKRISVLERALSEGRLPNTVTASVVKNDSVVQTAEKDTEEGIPLPEPPSEQDDCNPAGAPVKKSPAPTNGDVTPVGEWGDIISLLQKTRPLIAGVLQGSSAYIKGSYLLIDTSNSQFRTMVNGSNPLYRDSIRNAARQVLGQTYKLGPYRKTAIRPDDPLAAFSEKLDSLQNK